MATDVFKSAIKSRRRFTYEEVDEYLAAKALSPSQAATVAKRQRKAKPTSVLRDLTPEVDALLDADARAGDDPPRAGASAAARSSSRCRS